MRGTERSHQIDLPSYALLPLFKYLPGSELATTTLVTRVRRSARENRHLRRVGQSERSCVSQTPRQRYMEHRFAGIPNDPRLRPRGNSPEQGQPGYPAPSRFTCSYAPEIRLSDAMLFRMLRQLDRVLLSLASWRLRILRRSAVASYLAHTRCLSSFFSIMSEGGLAGKTEGAFWNAIIPWPVGLGRISLFSSL